MRVEEVLKLLLADELSAAFRDCSQHQVSRSLAISQGDVSLVRRGKLDGFSASRLLRYLVEAGYNLEIRLVASPTVTRKTLRGQLWLSSL